MQRENIDDSDDYELVVYMHFDSSYDDIEGDGVYAQEITVDTSETYEAPGLRFSSDIQGIKDAVQYYLDCGGPIENIIK